MRPVGPVMSTPLCVRLATSASLRASSRRRSAVVSACESRRAKNSPSPSAARIIGLIKPKTGRTCSHDARSICARSTPTSRVNPHSGNSSLRQDQSPSTQVAAALAAPARAEATSCTLVVGTGKRGSPRRSSRVITLWPSNWASSSRRPTCEMASIG